MQFLLKEPYISALINIAAMQGFYSIKGVATLVFSLSL